MKINFWGVRGSIATPGKQTSRIGGNTSCVEVTTSTTRVILDAGTGLRALGQKILRKKINRREDFHIFLSHYHIDHIYGLPFFGPLYDKRSHRIHLYGPAGYQRNLRKILDSLFAREFFPVSLKDVPAQLSFHSLNEKSTTVGDIKISSFYVNHPGMTLGYILEDGDTRVGYLSDHEPFRKYRHKNVAHDKNYESSLLGHLQGLDLLIHDAHFSDADYPQHRGWGHSSWGSAVQLAEMADVKRLALFHHSPDHDDRTLEQAHRKIRRMKLQTEILLPREGSVISIS